LLAPAALLPPSMPKTGLSLPASEIK